MIMENNCLEDLYGDLSQTVLMDFLKSNGYSVTKTTLTRYIQAGLVLAPKKKSFRGSNRDASRVFYHPTSIVEFMTAYLMFKGDWRVINSDVRIPRFTADDIFLAHLKFIMINRDVAIYKDSLSFELYYDSYWNNNESYLKPPITVNELLSSELQNQFLLQHVAKMRIEGSQHNFAEKYMASPYSIYEEIFMFLINEHYDKLNKFFNSADKGSLTCHRY